MALLHGVQAALTILSGSLCLSSIFSSAFLGWPERGNHLFARRGAFKGPLRSLPIHTPDRSWSVGSRAYQPREILTRLNLGLFILSHTQRNYPSPSYGKYPLTTPRNNARRPADARQSASKQFHTWRHARAASHLLETRDWLTSHGRGRKPDNTRPSARTARVSTRQN